MEYSLYILLILIVISKYKIGQTILNMIPGGVKNGFDKL